MEIEPQKVNKESDPKRTKTQSVVIPVAIIFAFSLVAVSIFFSGSNIGKSMNTYEETSKQPVATITPINKEDHIRGNPNAPIVIIEYSDFDCPFCKQFHETMKQIMDTYGTDGTVAWVIRQFPIDETHPNASYIAEASECVAELGGNEAFWKFSDLVFEERSDNEFTDTARLSEFAVTSGVGKNAFELCLSSNRTKTLVNEDFTEGVRIGVRGTPYSVVIFAGEQFAIDGAQSYEYVSTILDKMIAQTKNIQTKE